MKKKNVCALLLVLSLIVGLYSFSFGKEAAKGDEQSRLIEGQDLILHRRYDEALKLFKAVKKDFPDSPSGSFGEMAVYEVRMLENEDLSLEKEFSRASEEGRRRAGIVLQKYQPTPWELFISGALFGLDGFLKARKGGWWDAYVAGNKSRQLFKHAKQLDPSFIDADFGLGMYVYWRSVFTKDLWFLKMFPDRRAEGIAIVKEVAERGRFTKEMAGINLGMMYMEEKDYSNASMIFKSFVERYPENIVLRRFLGKVYVAMRKYDDAIAQFSEMGKIDPRIIKYKYFLGATMLISGDDKMSAEGERELRDFIAAEKSKYWRASAHYWLGRMYERKNDKKKALIEYNAAHALSPKIEDALKRARGLGGGM